MTLLESIGEPGDLAPLSAPQQFDSPRDRILWDTGHQSCAHKLLTGRQDFSPLRARGGGLSGHPCRAESAHDVIENSPASTAHGWADGPAKANDVLGRDDHVVAVTGDGALTGGMAREALNNIAPGDRRVAVVEDNCRTGGDGWAVGQALREVGVDVPLRTFGIPGEFLAHAKRGEVLADIGLTPVEIAGGIGAALTGRSGVGGAAAGSCGERRRVARGEKKETSGE
ncbi:1-deoxy-D-xylulose-5-phosphate synthase N-terminal domain-containing protein [Streptomyces sp. NBC_00101]|uniref:1-deoxy-D-xylulose-5-phosphate synthase N-terminal domain-containing protein n=1 Tax=Streptomyces sp. NBC_00101 TaxID=2975651 RepID=UPI003865622E